MPSILAYFDMDDTYNKFKEQIEKRYQESLKLAEKQRIDRIKFLDELFEGPQEKEATPTAKKTNLAHSRPKSYGNLTATTKKALELVPTKFTKQDIKLVWPQASGGDKQPFNANSLTGCLIRLEKQGLIKKLNSGSGSIPGLYKKIEGLCNES